ncbi:hypothetical protein GCM10011391_32420 [Pullulanibacillus camelliae]|uniref:DUF3899 domain-containing protein n=1 Tax=Pullulanibacillus camelliae TaxID=1707096 RepID=A0A8J2YL21_9BACL|nr:DUF3899 domain-containing protein [Pullulanibacillus camelliae]GGE51143.1 hypothetical protein GCM10011391_32420 [Pullulanibacillus camelliae]
MSILKFKSFWILGIAILFFLIYIAINSLTFLTVINGLSFVGIVYLLVGFSLFVFYGGFFNIFGTSFKRFFKSNGQRRVDELNQSEEEVYYNRKAESSSEFNPSGKPLPMWVKLLILYGAIFFIISLILSFFY